MPWMTAHPCRSPGCGTLIRGRQGFCSAHRGEVRSRQDAGRPSATRRGYDADWRRRRAAYLAEHPECTVCHEPATEVDHVVPLAAGGPDEESNYQALCKTHHSVKTGRQDRGPRTA